jgi:DNA-binding transcriptional MerR regulator
MHREPRSPRALTIGEFAAATQLTPKALRLYDDQGLLRPAMTAPNGYRVYGADQVPAGRLIRALRDMNLSLAQVALVMQADELQSELLLREYLQEAEQRYARERRAYQAVLGLLRHSRPLLSVSIEEISIDQQIYMVHSFTADRSTLVERYVYELREARQRLAQLKQEAGTFSACLLLEPLSEEEGLVELIVPMTATNRQLPLTTRTVPARRYAVAALQSADPASLIAAVDALFDWFDRQGLFALDTPLVSVSENDAARYRILWAFESK